MSWPTIIEGRTYATKSFFESLFKNVEAIVEAVKSEAVAAQVTATEALTNSGVTSVNGEKGAVTVSGGVSLSGSPFLFGVNGAYEDHVYWTENNVKADRGGGKLVLVWNNSTEKFAPEAGTMSELIAAIGERLTAGITPIVQFDIEDTLYLGKVNAKNFGKAGAVALAEIMAVHSTGVEYELVNEPYLRGPKGSNASTYAELCREFYKYCEEDVTAKTIPSLPTLRVFGWGRYTKKTAEETAGEESKPEYGHGWIADFFATWPEGKTKINGYTCHAYGYVAGTNPGLLVYEGRDSGFAMVGSVHAKLVEQGASAANNILVSECGFNRTELAGATEAIKEAEQATLTQQILERAWEYYAEGWLRGILLYNNSSTGWGIYGKPAGAVLAAFAAAHKTSISGLDIGGWPPAGLLGGPVYPSGITTTSEQIADATRVTEVKVQVKLAAGKTAWAQIVIANPAEAADWIEDGNIVEQSSENKGYIVQTLVARVPPNWKWKLQGENFSIENSPVYWKF